MKIKPLYIYLTGFVVFIVVIIFFALQKNDRKMPMDAVNGQAPNDEVHKGMGNMGAMSEAFKKREADLKAALDKNPNDTLKLKEYAQFLMQGHKPVESIKALEQILKIGPKRIDIMLNLTFMYDVQGRTDDAEALTNKILSIDPNRREALFNLGVIMEKKGNKVKAKQLWNDLIKKYPDSEIAKMSKDMIDQMK